MKQGDQIQLARSFEEKSRKKLSLHGHVNEDVSLDSDGNPQHYDFSEEVYEVGRKWRDAGCHEKALSFFEKVHPKYFASIGSSFNLYDRKDLAEHFYKKAVEYHELQGILELGDYDMALAYEAAGQPDKAYHYFYKSKYEEIEDLVHEGIYADFRNPDETLERIDKKISKLEEEMYEKGIKKPKVEVSKYAEGAYDKYYSLAFRDSG